ncbi:eukaryotic translation initiation factor 3 subunit J-A-like [Dioscorea cayenensis subsp. rotundata]|uniref:Eukaryotic translation initiation factor 3 subunit J n=1 Tax=Dioscorea cayennensis subsp. rotundata TaxID=55577 RepID=A0AB40AGB6_DIOCR|nr:eukaryotic translation initiation factor 3 subunit J-A-like [Dioscorea cayenensis subsp. rotundata]XP_039113933.1 eukaryotic translation initiation factor 3 subunit J-A-like [Dioscorea cayenensis subsp. rotundata]
MDNWEDDEFVPPPPSKEPPKSKWDDEDVEDEDVKDSWEDDDTTQAPKSAPPVEKTTTKPGGKAAGKKVKEPEQKPEQNVTQVNQEVDEVLSDPVAEKLRQQRLVEEADYKSTAELFSKSNNSDAKSLENFIPNSESDFTEYAELISHKIRPYEKSFHYIGLLKAVMRLSMTALKAADAKEIATSVTAIANEKLKAEKEANAGKKKQGAKKKQLHVGKPDEDIDVRGTYDDLGDDYDFM